MCIPSIEARSTERGYESIVKYCFFIVLVLIDTWWNVNQKVPATILSRVRFNRYMVECEYDFQKFLKCNRVVLIDTWWNVNSSERSRCKQDSVRFNRYMVECEFVIILESNEAPERF